jgi:hypothetical protein
MMGPSTGQFADDLPAPTSALHAAFLRPPHAYAELRSVDAAGDLALLPPPAPVMEVRKPVLTARTGASAGKRRKGLRACAEVGAAGEPPLQPAPYARRPAGERNVRPGCGEP